MSKKERGDNLKSSPHAEFPLLIQDTDCLSLESFQLQECLLCPPIVYINYFSNTRANTSTERNLFTAYGNNEYGIIYANIYLSVRSMSSFPSICSLTFLADVVVRSASLRIAEHKIEPFVFYTKNIPRYSEYSKLDDQEQAYSFVNLSRFTFCTYPIYPTYPCIIHE